MGTFIFNLRKISFRTFFFLRFSFFVTELLLVVLPSGMSDGL